MKPISNTVLAAANTAEINLDGWLGGPVLIPGEDAVAFQILASNIRNTLNPKDAIQHILIDDVIGHAWEVRRLRRLKGALLLGGGSAGLTRSLTGVLELHDASTLAKAWAKREPGAVARVEQVLASSGFTYDVPMAESLVGKIDLIRAFDALMASAESRFAAALRELQRYRRGADKAVREIVDAEFEDFEGSDGSQGDADDQ